jgi:hypothetical protein
MLHEELNSNPMKKSSLCLAVLFIAGFTTSAQPGPSGSGPGMDANLIKLFGSNAAFSAKAEIQTTNGAGMDMAMTMDFALLGDKARSDVNMADMKSSSLPPQAIAQMKHMGMERVVSIVRPDQKFIYLIYPGLQSYAKMPLPDAMASTTDKEPKMEKTALGKETIDSHPCVKNRVVMTTRDGLKQEFTTWNASDLKDFPIQIQAAEQGGTVLVRYKDIKFEKPDLKQFEPPAGYTAYDDIQKMVMSAMQKMMPTTPEPPPGNK